MPKPDFLVIGGQKCGSTELCARIASHPRVAFARPKELFFFCRDDVDVLPYPFFEHQAEWAEFDWNRRSDELLRRYEARFAKQEGQICGEGTPQYLPSRRAAARIREAYPDIKLVVILRNPTERAYSAYWHHVKMRRSTQTFENHLQYETGGTLAFGRYREQIEDYLRLFSRDQLHVVLFEQYVRDRERVLAAVFDFLGIGPPPAELGANPAGARDKNAARVPRSPGAQRVLNAWTRTYASFGATIEYELPRERDWREAALSKVVRAIGSLNLTGSVYPPMRGETRARLEAYYRRENEGLGDLIGLDVEASWGWT